MEYGANAKRFNAIIDCVGSDDLFRQCASYLDESGVFITIVGGVGAVPILRSKVLPVALGGVPRRYKLLGLFPDGPIAKEAAKWIEESSFQKFPIDSEYSMDDAVKVLHSPRASVVDVLRYDANLLVSQGYERVASKRSKGKVVVKVS